MANKAAVLAGAALLLIAGLAQAAPLVTCGGVSYEGRRELDALERESNVKLVFATAGRGAFLADVAVVVADARGRPVADTVAQGPLCLFSLPAGRYRVSASAAGVTRSATVEAPAAPGKPRRVVIAFPAQKETILATEEEKAPVRERW